MNALKGYKNTAILLFAIGSMAAPAARAQVADTSEWLCEFCPFESGKRADVSVGASSVSDDSAYFGDASGYSEEGVYANLDGTGSVVSDGHQLQWQVDDLGLDSRVAALRGARPGSFDYSVAYRQIPRHQYFTTDSIFLQSDDGTLSLPAGWVRAPVTSGFTELDSNLERRDIESERRIFEVGGNYLASSRFKFSANYRRQERDGLGVYGGSYFTQSSLLPGSFDYATDVVDFGVRYAAGNGILSLDYYVSEFDNSNTELRWENPFTSAPGAEIASLARPPDNSFQQVSLTGRYRFSTFQTVTSFTAAMGRMEQDEVFLSYTTNPNLAVSPLPRSSLDGRVDTTNFAFSLTSRPFQKFRVKLNYRYNERDNQTAQSDWTRVIADTFVSGESETNIPYSFERSVLNLSAEYRLFKSVRISGGYDRKTIDRNFQEVAEQTEDTGGGGVRWRPGRAWDIDFRAGASKRDIDQYNETVGAALGQNPLMRKYNLAYRYRRFGEMRVAVSPAELPIAVTVNGLYAEDEYTKSQMGITAGEDLRFTADLSWALSDKASLYLSGGSENIESEQLGSELFAAPDWRAANEDHFDTVGAGFRIMQISGKFDLRMDYTRSDGTSKIVVDSASGGVSEFPDLKSTLDYLRIQFSYRRSDRVDYTMKLRYQKFTAEDWSLEGVDPATIPVILTMGANPYDDEVLIVGLGVRYLFGQ